MEGILPDSHKYRRRIYINIYLKGVRCHRQMNPEFIMIHQTIAVLQSQSTIVYFNGRPSNIQEVFY